MKPIKIDQAKSKYCPYLNNNCIIDKCMAWEWVTFPGEHYRDEKGDIHYVNEKTFKNYGGHCLRFQGEGNE